MPDAATPKHDRSREEKEADIERLKRLEKLHFDAVRRDIASISRNAAEVAPLLQYTDLHKLVEAYHELRTRNDLLPELSGVALSDIHKYEEIKKDREKKEKELEAEKAPKEEKHDEHGRHDEPKYMDHDKRYQAMLMANPFIARLRKTRPDLDSVPTLITRDDKSVTLNPALNEHLATMGTDAFTIEEVVRELFRTDPRYELAAKKYDENEKRRIYANPEDDPALVRLNRKINDTSQKPLPSGIAISKPAYTEAVRKKEILAFVREYPQKAAVYAEKITAIQVAYQQVKQEENEKLIPPPPGKTSPPVIIPPAATPDRTAAPAKSSYMRPMPSPSAFSSPSPQAASSGQGQSSGSGGGNTGRVPSKPSPRSPQNTLGQAAGALGRLAQIGVKSASIWTNPIFWVILGLFLLIIIIIIILLAILGIQSSEEEKELIPVKITKSVDKEEVPNPPNTEDITYTINVSYPGSASDIIVEDPIPDGAEYVSSDPPGKTYDSAGKETSNAAAVTKVVWSVKDIQQTPSTSPTSPAMSPTTAPASSFNQEVFSKEGFPPPSTPATLDPDALEWWKSYFIDDAIKAAEHFGIDVGFVGFWPFYEGINFNLTFYNCNNQPFELRWNPNYDCYSTNTQVGPAIRYIDLPLSAMQDAFDVMYGNHSPETIQRVGQQVIENIRSRHNEEITDPSTTFPRLTIDELMNHSNETNRRWFVHLTRDDAISMYYLARTFKGHLDSGVLADTMECCWGGGYDRQKIINYIKAVYDAGLTGGGGGGGNRFSDQTLTLTVRAKTEDTFLINQASTRVIGGSRGPGQSEPATPIDLANVEKRLLPEPSARQCQTTQTGSCGRVLERVRPYKIVMHTTHGITDVDGIYDYFAGGACDSVSCRGVGSHFMIGQDGKVLQMVELFEDSVELAYAVGGYQNHISIEMGSTGSMGNYPNKDAMPKVQYDAARSLVQALMEKYDIPKGDIEWNTTVDTQVINDDVKGLFGHYQLNTNWAGDPGDGWLNDFRKDF